MNVTAPTLRPRPCSMFPDDEHTHGPKAPASPTATSTARASHASQSARLHWTAVGGGSCPHSLPQSIVCLWPTDTKEDTTTICATERNGDEESASPIVIGQEPQQQAAESELSEGRKMLCKTLTGGFKLHVRELFIYVDIFSLTPFRKLCITTELTKESHFVDLYVRLISFDQHLTQKVT